MAAKGYKIDLEKMKEALKLAQNMYEELEERGQELPDIVSLTPMSTSEDKVSNQYMSGQEVGARRSAMPAVQKYAQAFNAQMQYLGTLIPNLQAALARYAQEEGGAAARSQSIHNRL